MTLTCLAHYSGDCCGSQHHEPPLQVFVKNGTKVAKFREIVNHAIELKCNTFQEHCFCGCFSRVAHDKDWNLEEEVQGGA